MHKFLYSSDPHVRKITNDKETILLLLGTPLPLLKLLKLSIRVSPPPPG